MSRSASGISAAVVDEAAWVATNLAAGDHAVVAALLPAAPIVIAHLGGGAGQAVAVQSAWALGPPPHPCAAAVFSAGFRDEPHMYHLGSD